LRPITETCKPREDVLQGGLDDRHFAAQLDRVVANDALYEVYTDAAQFFDLTHPTSGLRELIRETFAHLTGQGGSPILRAQTSFGGGKTHSLIALYHLGRGFRPHNLAEFVDDAGILPTGAVRVAAVVGDVLDPIVGTSASGRTTYTLWGEIASQLGDESWAAVAEHDEHRTAPGTEAIRKMLDGGPAVIVIDEIAQHLRVCSKSARQDVKDQADQVAPFLKNLSEEVMSRDDVVVVITLATSADAYEDETEEVKRDIDAALKDVGSVLARKGSDIQPAAETEIADILKRRLFASIDPDAAAAAETEFAQLYAGVAEAAGITSKAASSITDRIANAYPFHPSLVDTLDKRIGTIPKFQRTRGALRLLSRVLAHHWQSGSDAVILNVADLPLDADPVLRDLTIRIDRTNFQLVVQSDITGEPGHAKHLDSERYQDRPFTRRAATTVLAHSLDLTTESGATMPDIAIGTLRPGDDFALIEEALNRLFERAWFLHYDNVRWTFKTAANATRVVDQEADRVLPTRVSDERQNILRRMCKATATIATHVYPDDLDSIPDEPKLHLVVPHHDTVEVTNKTADSAPVVLQEARAKTPSGKPRKHRNGIAYLIADADKTADMDRAVRRMIAANAIADDDGKMASYGDVVAKDIRRIADTSLLQAHIAIGRCYRHLYYPASNSHAGDLTHVELTADVQGAIGDRIPKQGTLPEGKAWTDQVWSTLVSNEKVRPSDKALGTDWLRRKAWPKEADRVRTTDVLATFWTDHSANLLADTAPVVKGIQDGVINGTWVVQDMRDATDGRGKVWSNRDGNTPRPVAIHDDVWLIDYEAAVEEGLLATPTGVADVVKVVDKLGDEDELGAADVRMFIEQAKGGHEPSKQEVRDALAEAVRQKRVVVLKEGEPVTAGDLTGDKVGFDELLIRKATPDDDDPVVKITRKKHFDGAAAKAAEELKGWVGDLVLGAHTEGLIEVGVTVEVDENDSTAAGNVILLLGSLPDLTNATFECEIEFGVEGVDGGITVQIDGADRRQAQQRVKPLLTAIAGKSAAPIDGRATVTFVLDEPHKPDSPTITGLFEAVTTYFTGTLRLTGRIA